MNCWLLLRRRGEDLWFSEGLYGIWAPVSIRKVFIVCRFVRMVCGGLIFVDRMIIYLGLGKD